MTDRHRADDELIAWALDDLTAADREAVAAHVARCPQCREMATELETALQCYRASRRPDAPARILVDLLSAQARHARGSKRRFSSQRWTPVLAAAALLTVVFLTGFWLGSRSESSPLPQVGPEAGGDLRGPLPEPPHLSFESTPPLEA